MPDFKDEMLKRLKPVWKRQDSEKCLLCPADE
jgi:hypothetical protein